MAAPWRSDYATATQPEHVGPIIFATMETVTAYNILLVSILVLIELLGVIIDGQKPNAVGERM